MTLRQSRAGHSSFPDRIAPDLSAVLVLAEPDMRIRGIVRSATLEENPAGSERIEMILGVQGVGPGQPRTLVVPYEVLLADPDLDADSVPGRRFEAEVDEPVPGRWVVSEIAFASGQFLRRPEED